MKQRCFWLSRLLLVVSILFWVGTVWAGTLVGNGSNQIPATHIGLIEKPIIASLATIMPNGQLQVEPVWCSHDADYVLVNSAKGRVKDKNMRQRPQVTLLLVNPENAFHWVEVRGEVEEITEEGADEHIDALAKTYLGVHPYPFRQPSEVRLIYKIKPTRVVTYGPPEE